MTGAGCGAGCAGASVLAGAAGATSWARAKATDTRAIAKDFFRFIPSFFVYVFFNYNLKKKEKQTFFIKKNYLYVKKAPCTGPV